MQVSNAVPDGLSYVSSNPPAEAIENVLRWRLGDLGPGQRKTLDLTFRAVKEGSVVNCVDVVAAGGLKVNDFATTTVTSQPAATGSPGVGGAGPSTSPIELRVSEPPPTAVGSEAKFVITITNRTGQPTERLTLYDAFEPGLQYKDNTQKTHINADLGSLKAYEPLQVPLQFKALQPGQHCHTVKVLGAGNRVLASQKACVAGVGPAAPPGGGTGRGGGHATREIWWNAGRRSNRGMPGGGTATAGPNDLNVQVTGSPSKLAVRETSPFSIDITNTSTKPLTKLKVEATFTPVFAIDKALASKGFWHDKGAPYLVQPELPAGQKLKLAVQTECLQASPKAICHACAPPAPRGPRRKGKLRASSRGGGFAGRGSRIGTFRNGAGHGGIEIGNDRVVLHEAGPREQGVRSGSNGGEQRAEDERNVAVDVLVPDGLAISRMGTQSDAAKNTIDKQTVRFDAIPTLPAGKSAIYRVSVQTKTAGSYNFKAAVSSQKLVTPTVMEKSVDVTQ